ncbi:ATP-binding protein [Knoellia aerolata]|uniref:Regulator n=1 Tax=Knoellia aerolata DSM 18566 TaxID=1385519 RepID=A0A0A0K442_9MICO|nr:ATP-binding protein [Knoellia aerolata]KGN42551.1 regulator [Knoellia aerolata DSM 18566]
MVTTPADAGVATTQLWFLPSEPGSAGLLRQLLRALLEPSPPQWAEDAVLVASEVVTNAVLHGEGPVMVRARRSPGLLRVEITDVGAALPHPTFTAEDAEDGRGLLIVEALAARWGVDAAHPEPGKTVWFEMGTAPSGAQ